MKCLFTASCLFMILKLFFAHSLDAESGNQDIPENKVFSNRDWEAVFSKGAQGFRMTRRTEGLPVQEIIIIPLFSGGASGETAFISEISDEGYFASVRLETDFEAGTGKTNISFTNDGIVTIRPGEGISGIRIKGDIEYGFLPGFFLEDIIYEAGPAGGERRIYAPSENIIGGFLERGSGILLAAWQEDGNTVEFLREEAGSGGKITSLDINTKHGETEIYTGILTGQGIWHEAREAYQAGGAEELELEWERPFKGVWRTQLLWNGIESFFIFREEGRNETGRFRGLYPAWFEDGKPFISIRESQAVLRPGTVRTLVYPFEGHRESVMGFLRRTPAAAKFEELIKADNPWLVSEPAAKRTGFRACAGTNLLKNTIIKAGIQDREQRFLNDWLDYIVDANRRTHEHRRRYGELTKSLASKIESWREDVENGDAGEFIRKMDATAEKMTAEYARMIAADGKDNPCDYIVYGEKLAERFRELITVGGNEYFPEYDHIITEFNNIIWGARHNTEGYQGGGFAHHLRQWAFEAALFAKESREPVEYAEDIRRVIREFLNARSSEATTIGHAGLRTSLR